jgi:hypothetical protein
MYPIAGYANAIFLAIALDLRLADPICADRVAA